MSNRRKFKLVVMVISVIGLAGCDSLGLISDSSPSVTRSGPLRNPETVTGAGQNLALEQKVIGVRAPVSDASDPNTSQTGAAAQPLIGVDSETPGLKVDQLIWACEGSYPASVNPEIGKYGCASYVSGFIDSVVLVQFLAGKQIICVPEEGISKDRAVKAFLTWGRGHPESHNENARSALMVIFAKEFPFTPEAS
jgi:hypothetical protein